MLALCTGETQDSNLKRISFKLNTARPQAPGPGRKKADVNLKRVS